MRDGVKRELGCSVVNDIKLYRCTRMSVWKTWHVLLQGAQI